MKQWRWIDAGAAWPIWVSFSQPYGKHSVSWMAYTVDGVDDDGPLFQYDDISWSKVPVEPVLTGYTKWDGCTEVDLPDGYHGCSRTNLSWFSSLLTQIYDHSLHMMEETWPTSDQEPLKQPPEAAAKWPTEPAEH